MISFYTPTKLSLLDITTMGDSVKRNDATKIGQFDSGLKYALAILKRNGCEINVDVDNICYGIETKTINQGGKQKEVLTILEYNLDKDFEKVQAEHITGFSLQLGYNWEIWMAFRELYSNMLDEGGVCSGMKFEEKEIFTVKTTINIEPSKECQEIWHNRESFLLLDRTPITTLDSGCEVYENEKGYAQIFKQGILVWEDKEVVSKFVYNITNGVLDERRILNDPYSIKRDIANAILRCKDTSFLRRIISDKEIECDFFEDISGYYTVSDEANKIATEVYDECGEVHSFWFLIGAIRERKDCQISGKKLKSVNDHLWAYSSEITLENKPTISLSIKDKILAKYNIEIDYDVKEVKLSKGKAVCDKFEKCIYVSDDFDVEKDFHLFLVQHIDLTMQGNIIDNLSKLLTKHISK